MSEPAPCCAYDRQADAAYIRLTDRIGPGEVARTVPVGSAADGWVVNLDVDAAGRLVGLEVLGASGLLRPDLLLRAHAAAES